MQALIDKIEELRKSLAAMKPKSKSDMGSLVPAIKAPGIKPISLPSMSAVSKPVKMPGVAPASNKDPKKMAEQLKHPKPTKPKIEIMKFEKNGQWSIEKGDEDKIHVSTSVQHLPEKGHAYLVGPEGNVRAKFFNGQMAGAPASGNNEPTKTLGKFGENNSV